MPQGVQQEMQTTPRLPTVRLGEHAVNAVRPVVPADKSKNGKRPRA
jgi:hypothetical protein